MRKKPWPSLVASMCDQARTLACCFILQGIHSRAMYNRGSVCDVTHLFVLRAHGGSTTWRGYSVHLTAAGLGQQACCTLGLSYMATDTMLLTQSLPSASCICQLKPKAWHLPRCKIYCTSSAGPITSCIPATLRAAEVTSLLMKYAPLAQLLGLKNPHKQRFSCCKVLPTGCAGSLPMELLIL